MPMIKKGFIAVCVDHKRVSNVMPQSHLLYGWRTAAVSTRSQEIMRRPQGRRTADPYFIQAVGVFVELKRRVLTLFHF